jgi:2-oxoglutarate dehydrogenase E2 component (dihydrolipoamide succinyltransferase)
MLIEVKVPMLPESITEATLVNWHKKPGDAVNRDENLIDIETDKVVLELPAPTAGVITEIRKPDGATVAAQEVIAVIDASAQAAAGSAPGAAAQARPGAPSATIAAASPPPPRPRRRPQPRCPPHARCSPSRACRRTTSPAADVADA